MMSRWVKYCSDRLLSDPELSVLKKGLNFAITPRKVPVVDVITAIEPLEMGTNCDPKWPTFWIEMIL